MAASEASKRFPPEVSYKDFERLLFELQQYLPTRVDMSYLSNKFSESTGEQLMYAMGFLNLIDSNNRPTPCLKSLVLSAGEYRTALMRQIADDAYAFVLQGRLNIQNATYNELEEVFLNIYRMGRDICRRCINFFIDLSEDAAIPLSRQVTLKRQMAHTSPGIQNAKQQWVPHVPEIDYGKHPGDDRLQQVKFLHTIAKDFQHFDQIYQKARKPLKEYQRAPKTMTQGEWGRVVNALSDYYESVRFLYKIALLTELKIIDSDLLYVFYYSDIVENSIFKLSTLIKWSGTGLDLAANYQSCDIAHIAVTVVNLINKLDAIYQDHRGDLPFSAEVTENFLDRKREFFSNPAQYTANADRIVTIQEKNA
jgi:hypothetical protein